MYIVPVLVSLPLVLLGGSSVYMLATSQLCPIVCSEAPSRLFLQKPVFVQGLLMCLEQAQGYLPPFLPTSAQSSHRMPTSSGFK